MLERVSLTYLLFASIALGICCLVEACGFFLADRPYPGLLAVVISAAALILLAGLVTDRIQPKRSEIGCLVMAAAAYVLILWGTADPDYSPSFHLAICMVAVGFFVPYVRLSLAGVCVFGITLLVFRYQATDGSFVQTLSYVLPSLTIALFGFWGQQSGLRHSFLRQIENEEMNRELQLARLSIEHSSHLVAWLNEHGEVQYGNQALCKALDKNKDQLRGQRVQDMCPDVQLDQWQQTMEQLQQHGSTKTLLKMSASVGKEPRMLEVQLDFVPSAEQQIICAVATDITERLRLEEEMRHLQKLEGLSTLAGGLAHDYNNLLTPIVNNATLLLDQAHDDPEARTAAQAIITASQRAQALTEQLMTYNGDAITNPVPLSVGEEIVSISEMLRSTLAPQVAISVRVDEDTPMVWATSAQLHQVLLNLVVNAGQAMPESGGSIHIHVGKITLSTQQASRLNPRQDRPGGEYVTCTIRDDGMGMNGEVRDRMFDPFFTTKSTGHGLGLSAVLGIMRRHGGGIQVESAEDEGTTIRLFLPAYDGDRMDGPNGVADYDTALADESAGLVLFVDDEPLIRNVGDAVLSANGFEVLLGSSATDAIEIFRKHRDRVDVVVLDNRMPGPPIWETVQAIRRERPEVGIIASSGYPTEIPPELRSGPQRVSFLPKPYQAQELASAVSEAKPKRRTVE